MVVSMSIMLAVTAGVFTVMNPAQGSFQTQPEVADMQQRLRVASDTLYKDMVMAGGGADPGQGTGSPIPVFAAGMADPNGSTPHRPAGTLQTHNVTLLV